MDYVACKALVEAGIWPIALDACNIILETIMVEGGNFNVYDIRKKCTYPPLCYDLSNADKFLAVDFCVDFC